MSEESTCTVVTRFGEMTVTENDGGVVVEAGFDAKAFVSDDSRKVVTFFAGELPHLYDEITQNGHTFEVQGTRITSTGKFQVENEQGVWEDYQ